MIYFRTSEENLYESVRQQLDAAWGHPTADGRTITCFAPANEAARDSANRIMLAVGDEFVTLGPVASLLPELLASGAVEQIQESDYAAAVVRNPP